MRKWSVLALFFLGCFAVAGAVSQTSTRPLRPDDFFGTAVLSVNVSPETAYRVSSLGGGVTLRTEERSGHFEETVKLPSERVWLFQASGDRPIHVELGHSKSRVTGTSRQFILQISADGEMVFRSLP